VTVLFDNKYMRLRKCKHGTFLYNTRDTIVGLSLDNYGEWAEGDMDVLGRTIKPGNVVVDVGAYIGTHTVFFSNLVGDDGIVVAIEPQHLIFQNLCANLALNALCNVVPLQNLIGKQEGIAKIPVLHPDQENNFAGLTLSLSTSGRPTPVVTIDGLKLSQCDLIKIDVEGMECDVIEGAKETIRRHKPVLFVENNTTENAQANIAAVQNLGYDAYWVLPYAYNPNNFFGNPVNVFSKFRPVDGNMLCHHRATPCDVTGLEKITDPEDTYEKAYFRQHPSGN
jgi:FkbM family methyltransferase